MPIADEGRAPEIAGAAPLRVLGGRLAVRREHRLAAVEQDWRHLESFGLLSPGQSLDFVRLWIETQDIPETDRFFLVAELDGAPLALLPLQRHRPGGLFQVLTWFPGAHVGAGAPLLDRERFAALTAADRDIVWQRLFATLGGIDALYLRNVPEAGPDTPDLLCGVGVKQPSDSLHRAEFDSWQQADTAQRGKSRRKHDRQQGDRLAALGEVSFEEIPGGSAAAPAALDVMFRQRHDRFVEMGVSDPFVHCCVRAFYDRTVAPDSPVPVRLHVLRLDGEIVAVRYSIALGDTLYCLISSMSVDPRLRAGSPGKQCLLNVMQTVFDQGWRAFDMGAGFTDEKRHWCNVQLRLSHRYVPLNRRGAAISFLHRNWQALRRAMKSEQRSHSLLRRLRARLSRLTG